MSIIKNKRLRLTVLGAALVQLLTTTAFAQAASTISSGDTAWMLVSTALVMVMTPGLAFFYGGMVRSKNAVSTMTQSFIALSIFSII